MKVINYLLIICMAFISCKDNNASDKKEEALNAELSLKVIAEDLSHPWEIIYGPDNHIWFTERSGRISRLDLTTSEVKPLLTISEVKSTGEGGLLGMALHPDFSNHPFVYIVYNYDRSGTYFEKVVRYTYGHL